MQYQQITTYIHTKYFRYFLLGSIVLLGILYVYFLNATVLHVVEKERLQKENRQLHALVGELEFTYIAMQSKITREFAQARGFLNVPNNAVAFLDVSLKDRMTLNQ